MTTQPRVTAIREVWNFSTRADRQKLQNIIIYQYVNGISDVTSFRIDLPPIYGNRCRRYWPVTRNQLGFQGDFRTIFVWNISTLRILTP